VAITQIPLADIHFRYEFMMKRSDPSTVSYNGSADKSASASLLAVVLISRGKW